MSARSLAIGATSTERNWDGLQFRLIFALSFVFHLAALTLTRLSPSSWRVMPARRSILAQAMAAAGTTAQIAFYG